MKPKHILSIAPVVALILLSLLAAAGCTRDGDVSQSGMMAQLPEGGYGYIFADAGAMLDNETMQDLYDSYGDLLEQVEEKLGVSLDQVTEAATNGEVILIKGNFVLEDITDRLEEAGYQEDQYNDVEIWESSGQGNTTAVAFIDNTLVVVGSEGEVEDCIDTIKGEAASLAENEDLRDMLDRLPDGVVVGCAEVPAEIRIALSYYGYSYLGNIDVAGASVGFKDSENLLLTVMLKFDSRADADEARDAIKGDIEDAIETYLEDYLEVGDLGEINVSQDGEYLTITAQLSMETLESLIEDFLESQYIEPDNAERANVEVHQAQTAVAAAMADAGVATLDGPGDQTWDGSAGQISAGGVDPAHFITEPFKATYTFADDGQMIGAANGGPAGSWSEVAWSTTEVQWVDAP
jgi:hypothetical protein